MLQLNSSGYRYLLAGTALACSNVLLSGCQNEADPNALRSAQVADDSAPAPTSTRGETLYLRCQSCHSLDGSRKLNGPALVNIVGQKAAMGEGYTYSAALESSDLTWTPSTLDTWIENPSALVPGTKMVFMGISDPADRAALIAYLEEN